MVKPWTGNADALEHWQAIVYVNLLDPKTLKSLADNLNSSDADCEWLWSHPKGGGPYSTPQPCLIQQDRQNLELARSRLNNLSN